MRNGHCDEQDLVLTLEIKGGERIGQFPVLCSSLYIEGGLDRDRRYCPLSYSFLVYDGFQCMKSGGIICLHHSYYHQTVD